MIESPGQKNWTWIFYTASFYMLNHEFLRKIHSTKFYKVLSIYYIKLNSHCTKINVCVCMRVRVCKQGILANTFSDNYRCIEIAHLKLLLGLLLAGDVDRTRLPNWSWTMLAISIKIHSTSTHNLQYLHLFTKWFIKSWQNKLCFI